MKNNTLKKRIKICVLILSGCLLAAGLLFILWMKVIRPHKCQAPSLVSHKPPVLRLSKENFEPAGADGSFQALIAYMYESSVTEDLFKNMFGFDVFTFPEPLSSVRMYEDQLESLLKDLSGKDSPRYALLGLDPYAIFLQSCSSREMYLERLSRINAVAAEHPSCSFNVILPDDNAAKWNSLPYDKKQDARLSYILMVRTFAENPNIHVYYHSLAEWVLYSDCLRDEGSMQMKTSSYNHLLALDTSSVDMTYMLTIDKVNAAMDSVIELASGYDEQRAGYPDLSGKKVFFLGDSIFGNFRDETSVTEFFSEMTGAKVYNLGQGGRSAVDAADSGTALGCAVDHLLGQADDKTFEDIFSGFESYHAFRLAAADLKGTGGKDSVFIIEYGLNDYFSGESEDAFRAAEEKMIKGIESMYPEAEILLVSPGFIDMYDKGGHPLGENGLPLSSYREMIRDLAVQHGCGYLSQTDDLGLSEDGTSEFLLPDLVHYNENGRYTLAKGLAEFFCN